MPPYLTLDIFNQDAFSVTTLSKAVAMMPYLPQFTASLGIFRPVPVATETVMIELVNGTLALVPTSPRGAPPSPVSTERRVMRTFTIPHLSQGGTVYADEVQGIREFGQSAGGTQSVQSKLAEKMLKARRKLEYTMEHLRLGALKGIIYDADGSTVIYNLFTEFGVTQEAEVDFALTTPTTDVRGICQDVRVTMGRNLGALGGNGDFQIIALCSHTFFKALIAHANVKAAYANWNAAPWLTQNLAYSRFDFGGISFYDYHGSDDGSDIIIANDKVNLFPAAPELFDIFYAPAEYEEAVNTLGLPFYAKSIADPWGKFRQFEVQTNPLPICSVPKTLMIGKKA